jgi:hypothetical protein
MHHQTARVAFATFLAAAASGVAGAEPAPPPAPYAPPFQLRPAVAVSVIRADTAAAFYDDGMTRGSTLVTGLIASYKLRPDLVPFGRFAVTHDDPTQGSSATGTSNALAGIQWVPKVARPWRASVIGAMTIPIGSGGGNSPDMPKAAANRAAILARSSMDNAMFAVNDLAVIAGASAAYVDKGLTLQAEVTLFELVRVRGEDIQPDKLKTNMTTGLFAGYFVAKQLSLGAEVRYQRYLSTPVFVANDPTTAIRDQLTVAGGLRTHFKLDGGKKWLRPGLAYARAVDAPMTGRNYQIVQLDLLFIY